MTQSEKLEALVGRAVENGWSVEGEFKHISSTLDDELIVTFNYRNRDFVHSASSIIFNHDFAKALFGEQEIVVERDKIPLYGQILSLQAKDIAWQYYIQQAVIYDNPIDYMYKEIFEK